MHQAIDGIKKRTDKSLTAQWSLDGAVLCCSSNRSHLKPPAAVLKRLLHLRSAPPRVYQTSQPVRVTAVYYFALCASRTFSENDCTMVAPADPCLSPTKGELVYSKTAKQCLEEISGTAGQHVRRALFTCDLSLCVGVRMRMCLFALIFLTYVILGWNLTCRISASASTQQ